MADGVRVPSGQPSPRPWRYYERLSGSENSKGFNLVAHDQERAFAIAWFPPHDSDPTPEALANVELVVAAVNGWDALRGERDRLKAALEPFAAKEECDIGFLVGEYEDHTFNCAECQRILVARAALGSGRPSAPEEET